MASDTPKNNIFDKSLKNIADTRKKRDEQCKRTILQRQVRDFRQFTKLLKH
jgi:hypothetical protein